MIPQLCFLLTNEGTICNTKVARSEMTKLGTMRFGEEVAITSYMNSNSTIERLSPPQQKRGPRGGGGIGGRG